MAGDLPQRPENESLKRGLTYQVTNMQKPVPQRVYKLPSGQTFNRKQWVRYMANRKSEGATSTTRGRGSQPRPARWVSRSSRCSPI